MPKMLLGQGLAAPSGMRQAVKWKASLLHLGDRVQRDGEGLRKWANYTYEPHIKVMVTWKSGASPGPSTWYSPAPGRIGVGVVTMPAL